MRKSIDVSGELSLLHVLLMFPRRLAFVRRPVPGTRSECLLLDAPRSVLLLVTLPNTIVANAAL
jgi:hypothetical protein